MGNDDNDNRTRSWSSWLKPNDEPRRNREAELNELHQEAQREAKEHIEASNRQDMDDPFIAFKHFIDRSIKSISALPYTMADNMRDAHELRERQEAAQRAFYGRWTGRPGREREDRFALVREDSTEDAEKLALLLARQSQMHNASIPHAKIAALYKDSQDWSEGTATERPDGPFLSPGGACYYKSDARGGIWGTGHPSREPRWLSIDWFKRSRYSPILLEADPQLAIYDTKWRHAFEDLLEAALDKPMSSKERFGCRPLTGGLVSRRAESTWRACGLDWMLSLQCRGILPPQVPSMYTPRAGLGGPIAHDIKMLVRELKTPPSDSSVADADGSGDVLASYDVDDLVDGYTIAKQKVANGITELDLYEHTEALLQGTCPDAVGRAIGEAARQERQALEQDTFAHGGGCPDELGRAIGQAAREERKCPDDLGRAVSEAAREESNNKLDEGNSKWQEYQEALLALEAQNKRRLLLARQELGDMLARQDSREDDDDEDLFDDDEDDVFGRDEDDDEEAEGLPGELWTRARQIEQQKSLLAQERLKDQPREERRQQDRLEEEERKASEPPRVLSALTTTQTTRSADGTVTTKVVLKKRFTDGSEETREQTHVFNDNDQDAQQHVKQAEEKEKKAKGWFWS